MSVKKVLPAVLVLLVVVSGVVRSRQVDRRDFWALNSTGRVVREFYVSPHESTRWGHDVLGRATLPNGVGTIVTFSPEAQTSCVFDFKLVYEDGSSDTYTQGRNVCRLDAILFTPSESYALSRP